MARQVLAQWLRQWRFWCYEFNKLSESAYNTMFQERGGRNHFDAAYGTVPPRAKTVSFANNIESHDGKGRIKIPVWVKEDVIESDEAIAQVLSHEICEIETLRYDIRRPVSFAEYNRAVSPSIHGNLHYHAVKEGDAMLLKWRRILRGN